MKTYITFGQIHAHSYGGHTLDKDSIACIEHEANLSGHVIAMSIFNGVFHQAIPEDSFVVEEMLQHFPRGIINLGYIPFGADDEQ